MLPGKSNVRSLLLKYATLFGIVAFGSLVISLFSPVPGQGIVNSNSMKRHWVWNIFLCNDACQNGVGGDCAKRYPDSGNVILNWI